MLPRTVTSVNRPAQRPPLIPLAWTHTHSDRQHRRNAVWESADLGSRLQSSP